MTAARPTRGRLTPDAIDSAALAIVDREGVAALTMRRLGAELGVEAMSLYHHVPGKDALLGRVAARVAREIDLKSPPGPRCDDGLRALGHAMRAALRAHPRAVPLLATRPLDPETGMRLVGPLLGPLVAAGFAEEDAYLAIQSVAVFTIGHALAETGAGEAASPAGVKKEPDLAADRSADGANAYYDRWFALGLEALISGLSPAP